MDPRLRAIVDKIKANMVVQAAGAHEANKHVPLNGKRHDLPLDGRTIDNDNLKAEALSCAEQPRKAGATVAATTIEGTPHGYFEYGFGMAMGQDFLDEGIKAQIADETIPAAAQKTLEFIKASLS